MSDSNKGLDSTHKANIEESFDMSLAPAVEVIKNAIQRSQARALHAVNSEVLSLNYGIGRYISENSRKGFWGTGALTQISNQLQKEIPGLKGYGETSLKDMRTFYEEWSAIINRQPMADDLQNNIQMTGEDGIIDDKLLLREIRQPMADDLNWTEFVRVPFTHHVMILRKEKTIEGRVFYIHQCAIHCWNKYVLRDNLKDNLFKQSGNLPNNFAEAIPNQHLAVRTMKAFKEEYLLDFINAEDLYADAEDRNEAVLNKQIVGHIRDFILRFGQDFMFIKEQYRVVVGEEEKFIDLLFFNRQLNALVAVELKDSRFQPAHLGQLSFYLSALDRTVRKPHENPPIGLLLCREYNRLVVEVAISDYSKPMGVATFQLGKNAPENLTKVLPSPEELTKYIDENE
jgi:predicted nuclease of restriction endonuclease-like (RecB) superfamily